MTLEEMTARVEALVGCERLNPLVPAYLEQAKEALTSHIYPYDGEACWDDVPERLHVRACEIAAYLLDRRGAEGEVGHSESGVSRTYASPFVPAQYFRGILPKAGVPR